MPEFSFLGIRVTYTDHPLPTDEDWKDYWSYQQRIEEKLLHARKERC